MRLLFYALCTLFLNACVSSSMQKKLTNMQVYGDRYFYYQLTKGFNNNAPKPSEGSQVRIDYTIRKADQILDASYANFNPTLVQIPAARYDNFFTSALKLMAEGDSLRVFVQAAKVPDMLGGFSQHFKNKDWVTFDFRMHEVIDQQTMQAQIKNEQQILDSIRQVLPATIMAFDTLKNKYEKTNSGIYYTLYEQGAGLRPQSDDAVQVHYICYSDSALILDDSFRNMVPLNFNIGKQGLISGFTQSVRLLAEGGRGLFFIPPHLAYGNRGDGNTINANAFLVFYIEMLEIN